MEDDEGKAKNSSRILIPLNRLRFRSCTKEVITGLEAPVFDPHLHARRRRENARVSYECRLCSSAQTSHSVSYSKAQTGQSGGLEGFCAQTI
ncbi:hypothetical protein HUJ04_005504 [Dendroctonus ponderosae]|nr:hypothetical protein HUJ04_005504 [Dendroctonus ponderosae]